MEASSLGTRRIGRYELHEEMAAGGQATVHYGRAIGDAGFARPVAIKRLRPEQASDPEFAKMLIDEGRLASRIMHANVVATLDVVQADGELLLVMEYVPGETLAGLVRHLRGLGERMPPAIAVAICADTLAGLHAAHTARDPQGEPLGIVHRDVSPQNILVGVERQARVLDFGIAKATVRLQTTRQGQLKGKLSYMAPELFQGSEAAVGSDVYGAAVVLWESLVGRRLFKGDTEAAIIGQVLEGIITPPSRLMSVEERLDEVVMTGLAREPVERYADADAMRRALVDAITPASTDEVARWVRRVAESTLTRRANVLAAIERGDRPSQSGPSAPAHPTSTELMSVREVTEVQPSGRRRVALGIAAGAAVGLAAWVMLTPRPPPALYAPGAQRVASSPRTMLPPPTPVTATAATPATQPPTTTRTPPRSKPDPCKPPWYLDKDGIKRVKRECLR